MQYVTVEEAIKLTGLSRMTLHRKAAAGEIRSKKIGIVQYCWDDLLKSLDIHQLINCIPPDLRQFIRRVSLNQPEPFMEVMTGFIKRDKLELFNNLIYLWRAEPKNTCPIEFVKFLQSLL